MDKEIIAELDLLHNPFTTGDDFNIRVHNRTDLHSLEKKGIGLTVKEYEAETDKCTKVYITDIKRDNVIGLKSCSQRLLLWMIYELDYGKDYVYVDRKKYMEAGKKIKDARTYKMAIEELSRYGYICPVSILKYKDIYWINPHIFFCGSRIKKYPKNLKVTN